MQYEYLTTYNELECLVSLLLHSPKDWLGCDTETTGLDCHTCVLSTVQISSEKLQHTYVIDVLNIQGWEEPFKKLIKERQFNWCFHNFKFDLKFFWKVGIDFQGCKVVDTMIVSGLLTAGLNLDNDLKSVTERYLGLEMDKEEQKSDWGRRPLSDSQLYYAAYDSYVTRLLGKKLTSHIKSEGITEVFKLEMRALPSFASMEYYGMNLDVDRLAQLRPVYEEKLKQSEQGFLELIHGRYSRYNCLGEIVNHGLDLKSPTQVLKVLRDAGIPNPLYDIKGKLSEQQDPLIMSTGSSTLKLLNVGDYVLLENLLAYRKAAKLLDAYVYSLPNLINPVTGRLHTHFRQSVSTGRASSSSPNLQNLSRPDGSELNLRSCFVPTEGYVLLDGDFSQIELRVIAGIIYNLSGDRKMLDEFIEGKDPYAATAALLSGMRYEDMVDDTHTILKQYKGLRQNAKAVRLGYNYCLDGTTLVPTHRGTICIKDIVPGDKVLTHTGRYREVTDVQEVYTQSLIDVRTSTGKYLRMTPDHKMLTITSRANNNVEAVHEWLEASRLKIGHYLVAEPGTYTEERIISLDLLEVYNYPVYDITVQDDHSFIANGLVSHNCMGAPKFKSYAKITYGVSMTAEEAVANRALYFSAYPGLSVYHDTFKDRSLRTVYTLPPFNRPRHFAEYPGIPSLSNFPVQGSSADIQKLSMATMYEELYSLGYSPTQSHDIRQICTIHDEIVAESIPELADQCAEIQERCMISSAKFVLNHCPIQADVHAIANLAMK